MSYILSNNSNKKKTQKKTSLQATRINKLPFHIQQKIYNYVTDEEYPKKENLLRSLIQDRNYISGWDMIDFDFQKIRKELKIKHYENEEEIQIKIMKFSSKYVFPLVNIIVELYNIIELFEENAESFSYYHKNINFSEEKLYNLIIEFNKLSLILLKKFNSKINISIITKINDFLIYFNKILIKPLPLLGDYNKKIYSNNSKRFKNLTRKIRSL